MKDIIFGGAACITVGLGVFYSPPFTFGSTEIIDISKGPVVPGSNDDIADKIINSPLRETQKMFKASGFAISRPSDDTISFSSAQGSGALECRARILRLDESRAQVVTGCTKKRGEADLRDNFGMSIRNSALVGIMDDNADTAFREYVHATLEERPYNTDKVAARLAGQTLRNPRALRAETALLNERFSSADGELGSDFCGALERGEFDGSLDVATLKAECAAR